MFIHSEIARMLANAKIEEAESRARSVVMLRSAMLERPKRGGVLRLRRRKSTPAKPAPGQTRSHAPRRPAHGQEL
jgi:hypothetical protein